MSARPRRAPEVRGEGRRPQQYLAGEPGSAANRLSGGPATVQGAPVVQCPEQEQEPMDPKIEMNHLRVLHDYLNQTLDVLSRGQRFGNGYTQGFGYSPFAGSIPSAAPIGTDVVYGPSPFGFAGAPFYNGVSPSSFTAINPFTGMPAIGAAYSPFGAYPQAWGQTPWTASQTPWMQGQTWTAGQTPWMPGQTPWTAGQTWPGSEVARQAQFNQALAAKQSVLEAMCRVAGIPV